MFVGAFSSVTPLALIIAFFIIPSPAISIFPFIVKFSILVFLGSSMPIPGESILTSVKNPMNIIMSSSSASTMISWKPSLPIVILLSSIVAPEFTINLSTVVLPEITILIFPSTFATVTLPRSELITMILFKPPP